MQMNTDILLSQHRKHSFLPPNKQTNTFLSIKARPFFSHHMIIWQSWSDQFWWNAVDAATSAVQMATVFKAQQGDRCQHESYPEGYSFWQIHPRCWLIAQGGRAEWADRTLCWSLMLEFVQLPLPHTDPDILLSDPQSIPATTKSACPANGTRFN